MDLFSHPLNHSERISVRGAGCFGVEALPAALAGLLPRSECPQLRTNAENCSRRSKSLRSEKIVIGKTRRCDNVMLRVSHALVSVSTAICLSESLFFFCMIKLRSRL